MKKTRASSKRPKDPVFRSTKIWIVVGLLALGLLFIGGQYLGAQLALIPPAAVPVPPQLKIISQAHPDEDTLTLGQILALTKNQLQGIDLAVINLACSQDLPGCENANIPATRRLLDQWAEHVRAETVRNHHLFTDHPENYSQSESYFDALMMVVILQEDMGIHYNLDRMKDMDFTHADDVLINGLIGPLREGTCSSMPVLYVSVARRLGYPVYLVATKGHLFCRWESDDQKVRFNIEGTNKGLNCYSDDYYRAWPFKLNSAELWSGAFLRNMSEAEAMAAFLCERGDVLEALGRLPESQLAYAEAHALMPDHFMYFGNLAVGVDKERMMRSGLLDPHNLKNPYRNSIPPNYAGEPPAQTEAQFVQDREATK